MQLYIATLVLFRCISAVLLSVVDRCVSECIFKRVVIRRHNNTTIFSVIVIDVWLFAVLIYLVIQTNLQKYEPRLS